MRGRGGEEWSRGRKMQSPSWAAGRTSIKAAKKARRNEAVTLWPLTGARPSHVLCPHISHDLPLTSVSATPAWVQCPAHSREARSIQLPISQYLLSLHTNKTAAGKECWWDWRHLTVTLNKNCNSSLNDSEVSGRIWTGINFLQKSHANWHHYWAMGRWPQKWASKGAREEGAVLTSAFFPKLSIRLMQRKSVQQVMCFTDCLNFKCDSGFLCLKYHFIIISAPQLKKKEKVFSTLTGLLCTYSVRAWDPGLGSLGNGVLVLVLSLPTRWELSDVTLTSLSSVSSSLIWV